MCYTVVYLIIFFIPFNYLSSVSSTEHIVVTSLPYVYYSILADTYSDNVTYSGLSFDIFNHFTNKYNLTYEIIEPATQSWGIGLPNGSWTGLIGYVSSKQGASVGITEFIMSEQRRSVVDFSDMFSSGAYVIVMKKPSLSSVTFFKPFRQNVWLSLSVMFIILILLSSLMYSVSSTISNVKRTSISEWSFLVLCTLFGQGMSNKSSFYPNRSLKIIMISWWATLFFIVSGYNSNLRAMFSTNRSPVRPESLQDVLQDSRIKILTPFGSYIEEVITNSSNDSLYHQLWLQTQKYPENIYYALTQSMLESLISDESKACIMTMAEAEYMVYYSYDELYVAKEAVVNYGSYMIYNKAFQYSKELDAEITRLREAGTTKIKINVHIFLIIRGW